jgi:ParB family chromosome partitioning protein
LPEEPAELWRALAEFDSDSQAALFAHCASLTVNIVKEPWNRRPDAFVHGDQLAQAVNLDMAAAGWAPCVDNYLGRVPKARILEAVREAKGEASAQLIEHLKKADMATEAARLLSGTGWLPGPLRLAEIETAADAPMGEAEALPDFLAGEEDEATGADPDESQPGAIAAE